MTTILLVWLSFSACAASLESTLIGKLGRARTPAELKVAADQAEEIRITRLACRLELDAEAIPYACYQALALEKSFGIRSARGTTTSLDKRCAIAARKLSHFENRETRYLSTPCRTDLRKALDLLAYKLESGEEDVERNSIRQSTTSR